MQWMKSLMNWKADIKMLKYDLILTRQAKRDLVDIGDNISYTLLEPRISYKLIVGLREKLVPCEICLKDVLLLVILFWRRREYVAYRTKIIMYFLLFLKKFSKFLS